MLLPTKDRFALTLARVACLVAAGTSLALLLQYLNPEAGFCATGGGCNAVKAASLSWFGSRWINLPLLGLLGYAALFLVSTSGAMLRRLGRWWVTAAALGGVSALGFVLVQAWVIKALCSLCLIVDAAAVVVAIAALLSSRAGFVEFRPLTQAARLAHLVLALATPLVISSVREATEVPQGVRELYVTDKVNVVEFADAQCPHCRRLHGTLKQVLGEFGEAVHFVQVHKPLAGHALAGLAAYAVHCAKAQGQQAAMADLVFEQQLRSDVFKRHAQSLGLDVAAFEACSVSEQTHAAVKQEAARLPSKAFTGLPTTFIDDQQIVGNRGAALYREVIESKLNHTKGLSRRVWFAIAALLFVTVAWVGSRRGRPSN